MNLVYDIPETLLKRPTPWCGGCSHGTIIKLCCEVIDEMDLADTLTLGGGAGCTGFACISTGFDAYNSPHGRAPTTATAFKSVNPETVVMLYQGDGDACSIGLGDTLHTANLSPAITVICANNSIYGMTGGQASATTPEGAVTTTTTKGSETPPIRVAELVATFERPAFVSRSSVHTPKHALEFKRRLKKALEYQTERNGYSFLEVLAVCVTASKVDPMDIASHVEKRILPVFPLGIFKDIDKEISGE
jgi:2-oxoglutarate ferredoxin oxidoreductase subunit beta